MHVPMQERCGKFPDETFPKSEHFWVVNQDLDQPNDLLSKSKGDRSKPSKRYKAGLVQVNQEGRGGKAFSVLM